MTVSMDFVLGMLLGTLLGVILIIIAFNSWSKVMKQVIRKYIEEVSKDDKN